MSFCVRDRTRNGNDSGREAELKSLEIALRDILHHYAPSVAKLDQLVEEPLPAASPLWAMEHVLITPRTAGETCRYEDDVLAIMQENLARLWRGKAELLNQVV